MEKKPLYLSKLNKPQHEAVIHEGSPLLILAGAGSGKTNAITAKISYLIDIKGFDPTSILAVTFTNKAAKEMEERVTTNLQLVGSGYGRTPLIRTFHSFGAWVLRRSGAVMGLDSSFTIYDDEDMLTLLHSIRKDEAKKDLKPYVAMISRAKDYCLGFNDDLSKVSFDTKFPEIYIEYQKKLDASGCVDFGDLIMKTCTLLREHKSVRENYRDRFKAILVDEYQDSNIAQFELLKLLAGDGENLTVVGDDDQSIYRFRGAEVKNILNFSQVFKHTKIIKLEQNYRSTSNILDIASAVVANNTGRIGKKLWTENKEDEKSVVAVFDTQQEEAKFCAKLLSDGNYSNTAILYRTNAQSLEFESLFSKHHIPYRLVGALRFFEREEVKDILAWLSVFINPKDEVSFRRVINKPARGLGKTGVEKIVLLASAFEGNIIAAVAASFSSTKPSLSGKAATGAKEFYRIMEELKDTFEDERKKTTDNEGEALSNLSTFIKKCAIITGLAKHYKELDKIGDTQKILNIEALVNHAADFPMNIEGLIAFLENTELDRTSSSREDGANSQEAGVTLITMHNTKGLEFDRVIITGLEEGLFPGYRSMEDEENIEEERRIFYVSITRARKTLYMSCCKSRRIWGRTNQFSPSRFLSEIPGNLVVLKEFDYDSRYGNYDNGRYGSSRTNYSSNSSGQSNTLTIKEGDVVQSPDYGKGQVVKRWVTGKEPIVAVYFPQTGKSAQFLLRYCNLRKTTLDPETDSDW